MSEQPIPMNVPLIVPRLEGDPLPVALTMGECLFLVGANGSGKSTLLQHLTVQMHDGTFRRIAAHRQNWLESGRISLTAAERKRLDQFEASFQRSPDSVWRDNPNFRDQTKLSAVLYDVVAMENVRARDIARLVEEEKLEEAQRTVRERVSLYDQIRMVLEEGNLAVTLDNSDNEEIVAYHKNSDHPFNIAHMSDGERNAVIIATTVLTAPRYNTIIIDEPERHLHRSIITPLLSVLFEQRKDCAFIISTHETSLPLAYANAKTLIVRSCHWQDNFPVAWDVDMLEPGVDLPNDLKQAILGSRKRVLFIEGAVDSLDLPLYTALFPDISVRPIGSFVDVRNAVSAIRASESLHHIEAFGLIDRDNREEDEVTRLAQDHVYALDAYSVESLYYCRDSLSAVAYKQGALLGHSADSMVQSAMEAAFTVMVMDNEKLLKEMAARRCVHIVRSSVLRALPTWKNLIESPNFVLNEDFSCALESEISHIRNLCNEKKFDELIARYPWRKSHVPDVISKNLSMTRNTYERALIASIRNAETIGDSLRKRIGNLSAALAAK